MFNKLKSNPLIFTIIPLTVLVSGFYLVPIQLFLHFVVKPISSKLYKYLHVPFCWTWISIASFTVDYWSQSKIILYTKDGNIEKIQNSYNFLLANHSSGIDHFVPVAWADKIRILGSSNAFMKKSIMYFPIIGQCFLFCCRFIFLDRSFEKDEKNIKNQLENFIKLKSKAASSILYPEGTRFTKEKLKDSIEFAKSRNLPTLQYHLIPRTKGFKTCVEVMKNMKEKCAVINYQTYFKGPEPTIMNLFKGKSMEFHIFIDYIPIENVEATDKWLIDLFKTKDELHESFEKFGNFHKGRNLATIKGVEMKPRKRVLINFLFWLVVTVISCIKFSSSMIQSGYFMILIAVILTFLGCIFLTIKTSTVKTKK